MIPDEIQTKLEAYFEIYDQVKSRVKDPEVAAVILQEFGKTQRTEMLAGETGHQQSGNNTKRVIREDEPATESQLRFLRTLGYKLKDGVELTRLQASQKIDELKE